MKHQLSFRALFAIAVSSMVVFTFRVDAQSILKNKSSLTWGLGFGSGSYTGVVLPLDQSIAVTASGNYSFTKFATAFRLLLATNMLDSRLSIGGEYALQLIRQGGESIILGRNAPDAMIHSVLMIGDYLVGKISDDVSINAAGGVGVLFFANMTTRIEYDQGMISPQKFNDSKVQLAASVRLLAPIRVKPSFTIDPEIRLLASAGQEKVFLVQFLVGLTYRW